MVPPLVSLWKYLHKHSLSSFVAWCALKLQRGQSDLNTVEKCVCVYKV